MDSLVFVRQMAAVPGLRRQPLGSMNLAIFAGYNVSSRECVDRAVLADHVSFIPEIVDVATWREHPSSSISPKAGGPTGLLLDASAGTSRSYGAALQRHVSAHPHANVSCDTRSYRNRDRCVACTRLMRYSCACTSKGHDPSRKLDPQRFAGTFVNWCCSQRDI